MSIPGSAAHHGAKCLAQEVDGKLFGQERPAPEGDNGKAEGTPWGKSCGGTVYIDFILLGLAAWVNRR